MEYRVFEENGVHLVLGITGDGRVKLVHFSSEPFCEGRLCPPRKTWREGEIRRRPEMIDESFQLVQLSLSGYDMPFENHGRKYVQTSPGYALNRTDQTDRLDRSQSASQSQRDALLCAR